MLTPVNTPKPDSSYAEVESIGTISKYNKLILDYYIHMGYKELYDAFAKDLGIPSNTSPLFVRRSKIRDLIMQGDLDKCISELNDLDIEIVRHKEIFVHMTCHRAYEMKNEKSETEIITYLNLSLEHVALEFEDEIATLLEYLIINNKKIDIKEKREELADLINYFILNSENVGENELEKMIEGIVMEENVLSQRNKFVEFKERILEK